jgi:hypothetical protein
MSSVKFSELPAGAPLTGAEIMALVQNGASVRKTTAEFLADLGYSFGDWVPILAAASGGPAVYSAQQGSWERIGRLVIARFRIVTTGLGGLTGSIKLTGLPFPAVVIGDVFGTVDISSWSGLTLDANYTHVGGRILPSTTEIQILENGITNAASTFQLVAANLNAATTLVGTAMYRAA